MPLPPPSVLPLMLYASLRYYNVLCSIPYVLPRVTSLHKSVIINFIRKVLPRVTYRGKFVIHENLALAHTHRGRGGYPRYMCRKSGENVGRDATSHEKARIKCSGQVSRIGAERSLRSGILRRDWAELLLTSFFSEALLYIYCNRLIGTEPSPTFILPFLHFKSISPLFCHTYR